MDIKKHHLDVACISCGSHNWKWRSSLPRFLFGEKAKIFVCRECGCGVTIPPPNLYVEHYENNDQYMNLFLVNEKKYRLFAKETLNTLERMMNRKAKTLLDVGCGGGFLVDLAIRNGYKAKGIESNVKVVMWARNQGIPVQQGNIFAPALDLGEKFDVIVLSSVLEHIDHPEELLLLYKNFLSEDGVVFISQANHDGLLPKILPWGWYGWQPKEHYWHFTINSLKKLVENAGYYSVAQRKYSLYHPWFFKGSILELVGRNLSAIIARISIFLKYEDGFNMLIMKKKSHSNE